KSTPHATRNGRRARHSPEIGRTSIADSLPRPPPAVTHFVSFESGRTIFHHVGALSTAPNLAPTPTRGYPQTLLTTFAPGSAFSESLAGLLAGANIRHSRGCYKLSTAKRQHFRDPKSANAQFGEYL